MKKQKLVEYLYPTQNLMDFMCNDVYQELLGIIPINKCINYKNVNKQIREENFKYIEILISEFLKNKNYKEIICNYYKNEEESMIVYNILLGFVFYVSNINNKYKDVDILTNKKSICYDINSILNFL